MSNHALEIGFRTFQGNELVIRDGLAFARRGSLEVGLGPVAGQAFDALQDRAARVNVREEYNRLEAKELAEYAARGNRTLTQWLFDNGF